MTLLIVVVSAFTIGVRFLTQPFPVLGYQFTSTITCTVHFRIRRQFSVVSLLDIPPTSKKLPFISFFRNLFFVFFCQVNLVLLFSHEFLFRLYHLSNKSCSFVQIVDFVYSLLLPRSKSWMLNNSDVVIQFDFIQTIVTFNREISGLKVNRFIRTGVIKVFVTKQA